MTRKLSIALLLTTIAVAPSFALGVRYGHEVSTFTVGKGLYDTLCGLSRMPVACPSFAPETAPMPPRKP